MRRFKNISKKRNKELGILYKDYFDVFHKETKKYKRVDISLFDHWLSQDEAENIIDKATAEFCNYGNNLLLSYSLSILDSTEMYLVKIKGKHRQYLSFKCFTSKEAAIDILSSDHQPKHSKYEVVLAIPEAHCLYLLGSDFTYQLFFSDVKKIEFLLDLARLNRLHIL